MRQVTETDAKIFKEMRDEIARLARKVDGIRGPNILRNDRNSIVVSSQRQAKPRPPPPAAAGGAYTILKITGFSSPATLGGGKYWALVQKRTATEWPASSATLAMASHYENVGTSTDYVLYLNPLENASTLHSLAANKFVLAYDSGELDDTDVYSVYIGIGVTPCG